MMYSNVMFSFDEEDFTRPMTKQKYNLGEKVCINSPLSNSIYASVYMYIQCPLGLSDRPYDAYKPYMVGQNFQIDQYATPYEPNQVEVVCPQFDLKEGEYAFVLYQGEGLFLIEGSGVGSKGAYLKAEGDIDVWGYSPTRVGSAAAFLTEDITDRTIPRKGALFGHEVNVSPTA